MLYVSVWLSAVLTSLSTRTVHGASLQHLDAESTVYAACVHAMKLVHDQMVAVPEGQDLIA